MKRDKDYMIELLKEIESREYFNCTLTFRRITKDENQKNICIFNCCVMQDIL